MKLDFYNVDKEYIAYLQQAENQKRGFTRVPNMDYEGRKQKFLCGIILNAPNTDLKYFVGVTHYKKQKSENFLIVVDGDRLPVKGSLRFNYMFPVPAQLVTRKEILKEPDIPYRILLSKELKSINEHADEIVARAHEVYDKIANQKCSNNLLLNSCDFTYLEAKCIEYCKIHNLELPATIKKEEINHDLSMKEHTPWNDYLIRLSREHEISKDKTNEFE